MSGLDLDLSGAGLRADPSGALVWPARRTVAVADLHLEKASALAGRGGGILPPYDSAATLDRLETVLARHRPATVICLGDSFHDSDGPGRLPAAEAARLRALTAAYDWIWIAGNHDPAPPAELGGRSLETLTRDGLVFRHAAVAAPESRGEVSGHFHPKAAVRLRGRRLAAPCFAVDQRRLILPAFGAYTGGLSVLDPALRGLLMPAARALLLARGQVRAFPLASLVP